MRFFLHIEDGAARIEDKEGSDLPNLASAREEALASARQLWAAAILESRDLSTQRFVLADSRGSILAIVPFIDALPAGLRCRLIND